MCTLQVAYAQSGARGSGARPIPEAPRWLGDSRSQFDHWSGHNWLALLAGNLLGWLGERLQLPWRESIASLRERLLRIPARLVRTARHWVLKLSMHYRHLALSPRAHECLHACAPSPQLDSRTSPAPAPGPAALARSRPRRPLRTPDSAPWKLSAPPHTPADSPPVPHLHPAACHHAPDPNAAHNVGWREYRIGGIWE